MKNVLTINKVIIDKNKLLYSFSFGESWNKYITSNKMFAKYNKEMKDIPQSIAVIPLLCNLLPIMWCNDLSIKIEELDSVFYENLENIKNGYINMYPDIAFKGNLIVEKIVNNKFYGDNRCVMFSGGVDAYNTLISHIAEKPDLLTIFGADVDLTDESGIAVVQKSNKIIANKIHLHYNDIFSDFRSLINYNEVNQVVKNINNYEWWHDFQHGLALLGLTAPLSYINKYSIVYIASSFTESEKGNYTCASDPTIDNYFCHSSSKTIHDGYNFNRQDKIRNICEYITKSKDKINVRVCWQSRGGRNCCACEKCYRTIMAILAEGKNPADFGFNLTPFKRRQMMAFLKLYLQYNEDKKTLPRYKPIQNRFMNYEGIIPKDLKWIKTIKICSKKPNYIIKFRIKIILFRNKFRRKIMEYIK